MENISPSFIFLSLVLGFLAFSSIYAWLSLAPWVPSNRSDLKRIHTLSKLKPGQTFLEMGCGNGRVCRYIAKKNPKANVIGIELAFPFYLFTKIQVFFCGPKNLTILWGNALKHDIPNIDVIYVYGLTKTINAKLKTKIENEMKTSGKFISYVFPFKKWKYKQTIHKPSPKEFRIYIYEKEVS
jgi:SAM-dependent methyltransferase